MAGRLFFSSAIAFAQNPSPQPSPAGQEQPRAPEQAPVVRITTRLVQVSVVVTDRAGKPVTDLKQEDFTLLERGVPQRISTFSREGSLKRGTQGPPRSLPAHYFSNRPEYQPRFGPVTVILLDLLNTPLAQQPYAREQVLAYFKSQKTSPGRTAVLVLGNELRLVQDFTSDPSLLRAAVGEPHLTRRPLQPGADIREPLPAIQFGSSGQAREAGELYSKMVETLNELGAESTANVTETRVQVTLAALRSIARALARRPGRKNLIWISAAFPLYILPHEEGDAKFPRLYVEEVRQTAQLLTDADTAVYPVDARGLVGSSLGQADGGSGFGDSLFRTHAAMRELADDTGGQAFYDRNDIGRAIALSVDHGSHAYLLGYYPSDRHFDGSFRTIQVKASRPGLHLDYRRGYFALDVTSGSLQAQPVSASSSEFTELVSVFASQPAPSAAVTFFVHVLPPLPAPRGVVAVDFSVDAETLSLPALEDGRHRCDVEFLLAAVSPSGTVVGGELKTLISPMSEETYSIVKKGGLPLRLEAELPPGRYQLKLGVRDRPSGRLGVLTVPLVLQAPPG